MFRRHSRAIAAVVLGVFTWTSGGVFSVAHAAQDALKKAKANEQQQGKGEGAEERLSRLTEELRETLADPKADHEGKKRRLSTGKSELAELDVEIRKQFAETEKKLKDAKLPAEIMERHYKFVKHYDDNLAELKGDIERVEKAKDKKQAETEIGRILAHLEKVKTPSRHQPLDPNNLPFRQPKVIKREPRMTKEEFERDLKKDKNAWRSEKRIMVASTGSVTGLLLPDDLAETIEVQFTPEIKAKAQELGNNPVKIYEWVRNNVEFVPTWGSIQGAQMTMQTKQGNAYDTASLLIALLRAAGIQARYVTGTVEVPIDKVMNWAGGFTDPAAALNFIASGGVPVTGLRSGGKVVAARFEHIWVKAFVDYVPSFGAVHKAGDTWIPLDASFKKYNYTDGLDFKTLVAFDGPNFAAQLQATSTVNEVEGYVTNVNSSTVQAALSDYNARLENYVAQNLPNATVGDILGKKEIIRKEQAILPASLPYKVVVAGTDTINVPIQHRHSIGIQVVDPTSYDGTPAISYSASLPQVAGKRITVSFDPATPTDKAIIDNYVAQQATILPAYMIQVIPTLRIDNAIISSGSPIGLGSEQHLSISISSPRTSEKLTHYLYAGDYTAISLNPSKINLEVLHSRIDKNDFSEPVGEMLHQTALSYWGEVDAFNDVIAKTIGVRTLRHPSELAATAKISLSWLWGIRAYGTYKSRNIDVKLDNQSVMGEILDNAKEFAYMQQSGRNSSLLEGAVLDQLFGKNIGDSISAVTAMKLANDQGVPIYQIDANNVATVIPQLQLPEEIKTEVANAVNAGLTVRIPKTSVTQFGWTGVGYIVLNPGDGTAAYRISGGLNGGDSSTETNTVYPLAKVPATGTTALVIGAVTSSSGAALVIEGGVIVGVALTGVLEVALLILLLAILVTAIAKTSKSENWKILRHYSTAEGVSAILGSFPEYIKASGPDSELGAGAYLTDYFVEPDNGGPISLDVATKLGMPTPLTPDPMRVIAYIDLKVNWDIYGPSFIVKSIRGANQYCFSNKILIIDHVNVKIMPTRGSLW